MRLVVRASLQMTWSTRPVSPFPLLAQNLTVYGQQLPSLTGQLPLQNIARYNPVTFHYRRSRLRRAAAKGDVETLAMLLDAGVSTETRSWVRPAVPLFKHCAFTLSNDATSRCICALPMSWAIPEWRITTYVGRDAWTQCRIRAVASCGGSAGCLCC
jgi:hypothetical protein